MAQYAVYLPQTVKRFLHTSIPMLPNFGYGYDLFAVLPGTQLQEHAGNDKSVLWHANDFSEGELKEELFTMRFGSIESEYHACILHVSQPQLRHRIISVVHCVFDLSKDLLITSSLAGVKRNFSKFVQV